MSRKNLDACNRLRSKVVAFRMSPEENDMLDARVRLSGRTKQDYIIDRVLQRDVVINGNPRVFCVLRTQLEAVTEELRRIQSGDALDAQMQETLKMLATVCQGMMQEKT